MGFNTILSADDLRRNDLIDPPGWYGVEIDNYSEKEANTDKSTNCIFHFKILEGKYKGTTPQALFNEKALGFGKNLWAVLELPKDENGNYHLNTELFQQVAIARPKLEIYIKRGKSNRGTDFNDVSDYRKMK